jgi:hypothetical protein
MATSMVSMRLRSATHRYISYRPHVRYRLNSAHYSQLWYSSRLGSGWSIRLRDQRQNPFLRVCRGIRFSTDKKSGENKPRDSCPDGNLRVNDYFWYGRSCYIFRKPKSFCRRELCVWKISGTDSTGVSEFHVQTIFLPRCFSSWTYSGSTRWHA